MCEKKEVIYIEPNYPVTIQPTDPDKTTTATTDENGSGGPTTITVVPDGSSPSTKTVTTDARVDDLGSGLGSGATVYPSTTDPPTTIPPIATTCTKLRGGELLPSNNYLIMFYYIENSLGNARESLYNLIDSIKKVDPNFDMSKVKPFDKGNRRGFYYDGLSKQAVMKVCNKTL